MGISSHSYVGPYLILPNTKLTFKDGENCVCPKCQKAGATTARFCESCGTQLVKKDHMVTKEVNLYVISKKIDAKAIPEDMFGMFDDLMQPEYAPTIITMDADIGKFISGESHYTIDPSIIPEKMAAFRRICDITIVKWFKDNGLPEPEYAFGVVHYYS